MTKILVFIGLLATSLSAYCGSIDLGLAISERSGTYNVRVGCRHKTGFWSRVIPRYKDVIIANVELDIEQTSEITLNVLEILDKNIEAANLEVEGEVNCDDQIEKLRRLQAQLNRFYPHKIKRKNTVDTVFLGYVYDYDLSRLFFGLADQNGSEYAKLAYLEYSDIFDFSYQEVVQNTFILYRLN